MITGEQRYCWRCKAPIGLCMGGVAAGDLIEYIAGQRNDVRETCGKCVLQFEIAPYPLPSEVGK